MKKVLSILLVLTLGLALLAGCGADTGGEGDEGTQPLKVGFIYIGTVNDGGFTQTHHNGTKAMAEHFGDKVEATWIEGVDDTDKQASMDAATQLIDQGCNVVIGCSFGFMDALYELSQKPEYKDIKFLHFSGNKQNDNMDNYFGSIEEPRYLTGIVAGLMTKTNKLGYVAAYDYTEVLIGINAFTLGAQSVNPDVEVKVVYINSWYDPEKERAAADNLLAAGCDIIAQHCDTTGPQVAAVEAGKFSIGYNLDNSGMEAVKDSYLTAPIWHHEVYLNKTVQAIMDGTWAPESYYGTMAEGYVDLAPLTDLVPVDVKDKVAAAKAEMVAGTLAPFSGKIEYNDGTILCEEGQTLDRGQIWSINKLVKGAK